MKNFKVCLIKTFNWNITISTLSDILRSPASGTRYNSILVQKVIHIKGNVLVLGVMHTGISVLT